MKDGRSHYLAKLKQTLMLLLERVLTRALQSFLETMKVKLWQLQQSFIRVAEALALRCCIEDLLSLLSESSLDIS